MKNFIKIFTIIILFSITQQSFSQSEKIQLVKMNNQVKNETFHLRVNKGDILFIGVKTDFTNSKQKNQHKLDSVKFYRQSADAYLDNFNEQMIINRTLVDNINQEIFIPETGIYTLEVKNNRGRYNVAYDIYRIPASESSRNVKRAVAVSIPDTVIKSFIINQKYDYIRTAIPYRTEVKVPSYYNDQILLDLNFALRPNQKFSVPIRMPEQINSELKKSQTVKWGFTITVGDEISKAFSKKLVEVASAGITAGAGKLVAGRPDKITGVVKDGALQKTWSLYETLSTANELAEIGKDVGEISKNEKLEKSSDITANITGFTGLSDLAAEKITVNVPKIKDDISYEIYIHEEYAKLSRGEPATALQKGKGGYITGLFDVKNPNEIYYLVIENNRKVTGWNMSSVETIGKGMLSQYVYTSLRVFTQEKIDITLPNIEYNTSFEPVTNTIHHNLITPQKDIFRVVYEDQVKPNYKVLSNITIY